MRRAGSTTFTPRIVANQRRPVASRDAEGWTPPLHSASFIPSERPRIMGVSAARLPDATASRSSRETRVMPWFPESQRYPSPSSRMAKTWFSCMPFRRANPSSRPSRTRQSPAPMVPAQSVPSGSIRRAVTSAGADQARSDAASSPLPEVFQSPAVVPTQSLPFPSSAMTLTSPLVGAKDSNRSAPGTNRCSPSRPPSQTAPPRSW